MADNVDDQFWLKVAVVTALSLIVLIPLLIAAFIVFLGDDMSDFSRMLNGG